MHVDTLIATRDAQLAEVHRQERVQDEAGLVNTKIEPLKERLLRVEAEENAPQTEDSERDRSKIKSVGVYCCICVYVHILMR